jgi:hypothetical protein
MSYPNVPTKPRSSHWHIGKERGFIITSSSVTIKARVLILLTLRPLIYLYALLGDTTTSSVNAGHTGVQSLSRTPPPISEVLQGWRIRGCLTSSFFLLP